jgi:hypothetical protein
MATKKTEIDPRVFQNTPVFKKSPDHKTVYANVIRTAITPFDIRIAFGQVCEPTPESPAQHTEEFATVIMAPEEAKAMIPLLQTAVQGYEDGYGKIRDITPVLERMKLEALETLAKAAAMSAEADAEPKAEPPRKAKKN